MSKRALIVGAGLAGCTAARFLADAGFYVDLFDEAEKPGGLIRTDTLHEVIYEPHGTHVFHTDSKQAWDWVNRFATFRKYEHMVKTFVEGRMVSWPLQRDEVADLSFGKRFIHHLDTAGGEVDATGLDFESWCVQLMGHEAYETFVKGYTEKQWGRPARYLSAEFAPKRVQVRSDGDKRLFKDLYQGFPDGRDGHSYATMIDAMVGHPNICFLNNDCPMGFRDLVNYMTHAIRRWPSPYSTVIITVPLDEFIDKKFGPLEWRGLTFTPQYIPTDLWETVQDRMTYNFPGKTMPWIRTHETKVASNQEIGGTVVVTEFPGGPGQYYPVPDSAGQNKALAETYKTLIATMIAEVDPDADVFFLGRLASYRYMDMDDVIDQVLDTLSVYRKG